MRVKSGRSWMGLVCGAVLLAGTAGAAAEPQSRRLDRAKDLIADERWVPAIAELTAATRDGKEKRRDEALFWLAHCHNQTRDSASALDAIQRLENEFPKSPWVKPAGSLKLEIAQRLNRTDVLWMTALPPPPAPTPAVVTPAPPAPPRAPLVAPSRTKRPARVETPEPPDEPRVWSWTITQHPDLELRIQAMGSLILSDSDEALKVIPILRDIALEASTPGPARRAIFALAQSRRPEARSTVVEVAKKGPEPVQIEAVRALGRLRGPDVSQTLLQVYSAAADPVKYHVVHSLGQRAETEALFHIAESEVNQGLREAAIVTLGGAPGGNLHLRVMYDKTPAASRRSIISGLFNARDDEGLIRIATRERQVTLRREIVECLRLLGTARAKQYLEQVREK
jgi:HEAT repeats/Tetratricopeptide repeat